MDFRLPIPKNWQDFESICHQLWKEIWNDPNSEKNGRQGQAQNGIDVFGTPIYSKVFHGVQCKDKDSTLGSILKPTELKSECSKAKNFKPLIGSFTLATTSARDANLQKIARELSHNKTYPFSVQVWSWDDIQAEIAYRPIILDNYYPSFVFPESAQMQINLNRYSPKEQFQAYFQRPFIKNIVSKNLKNSLITLAYELTDNAYKYGQTKNFKILIEDKKITFKDDGIKFNPLKDLDATKASSESHIGSFIFNNFLEKYKDVITPNYDRITEKGDDYNILEFNIIDNLTKLEENDFKEIFVDLNDAGGRSSARRQAESIELPDHLKELIITITYTIAMSFSLEFIRILLRRLNVNQKLILSLPRDNMFDNIEKWFTDDRLVVKFR